MIPPILTLIVNDLAIAVKNKSVLLIIFIPFFVFISLKLVDQSARNLTRATVGFVRTEAFSPMITRTLNRAASPILLLPVSDEAAGLRALRDKKIDGFLKHSDTARETLVLVVQKKEALQTLAIIESRAALQHVAEGGGSSWISEVRSLENGGIGTQLLPTWILMLVLLVGFIILPGQVAEEKEKNMLLSLLQTPMHEMEWLGAKVVSGMLLSAVAIVILHLLSNYRPEDMGNYVLFILLGSFCFCSYGIFLGLLCRNQASARTLGVIFYLPHLLPCALADYAPQLAACAPYLPSYHLLEPVRALLFNKYPLSHFATDWLYLTTVGVITMTFSYLLIKKRWLLS